MAQTVSMQRGTGTCADTGSLTLFTNSASGLATRVICNWISFYGASQFGSNCKMHLIHTSSSGGTAVIGYLFSQSAMQVAEILPNNNTVGPFQWMGDASKTYTSTYMYAASAGASYLGSIQPSSTQIVGPPATNAVMYMPSNIWIGPSDTLIVRWVDPINNITANVAWSFTTVTES